MTLVYCIDTICHHGGMERVLTDKVNFLAGMPDYQVYVVTFHQKGRPPFFPLDPRVHHVDLRANIHFFWNRAKYASRLAKLVKEVRADVVISMCGLEMGIISRMNLPCRKIAEFHFSYQSFYIRGKQHRLPRFIASASRMDKFVVLTREDALQWKRHLDNVCQIYNPSTYREGPMAALDNPRCISGARLTDQKNFSDMLEVWRRVAPSHPQWCLDIYGDGPLKGKLMQYVADNSLQQSVFFHDPSKEFGARMLESSIYLMTSIYEGFPLALIEAATLGLPALSYACPTGPSEIINDGESGVLVPVGDIETAAERLSRMMDDVQLRKSMGVAAAQKAQAFMIEGIMARWDELFRSL